MQHASLAVTLVLAAWIALGFVLVRRAERRVTSVRPPSPVRAVVVAVGLGAFAVMTHSAARAAICGVACIALVAAAGADARTGYLFDAVTLPAAIAVLTLTLLFGTVSDAALGVVVLVGSFGALVVLSNGRLMGLGDVKAMYAIGAAFGPLESIIAIFAACVSGIIAVGLAGRMRRGAEVRFGPHLAVGSAFALIAGDPILHHVMGL